MPTTLGSFALLDAKHSKQALVVQKVALHRHRIRGLLTLGQLVEQGLIILGKANMSVSVLPIDCQGNTRSSLIRNSGQPSRFIRCTCRHPIRMIVGISDAQDNQLQRQAFRQMTNGLSRSEKAVGGLSAIGGQCQSPYIKGGVVKGDLALGQSVSSYLM